MLGTMLENKPPKIYFVSGISGVGKSSTLVHLKEMLPLQSYDVRDLDERGVPDGGGLTWLKSETRHWLDVAKENARQNKSTVITGFVNPELFKDVYKPEHDIPAELILLHASPEVFETRLRRRHPTPQDIKEMERMAGIPFETFIENNKAFAGTFRSIFEKCGGHIIETDKKLPDEVAREVVKFILR